VRFHSGRFAAAGLRPAARIAFDLRVLRAPRGGKLL